MHRATFLLRCTALSRWRSASDILLNMGLAVLVEVGLAVLEGVPDGVAVLLTEVVGDGDPATERKNIKIQCPWHWPHLPPDIAFQSYVLCPKNLICDFT